MSMLFKRIKDWATTITAFRTGDVIPVDGPSGTAKMTKDDLLRVAAQNTLGSIHSLSETATEADLVAGNFLAIDVPGVGGATKKLPAEDVAKRSVQNNLTASVEPVRDAFGEASSVLFEDVKKKNIWELKTINTSGVVGGATYMYTTKHFVMDAGDILLYSLRSSQPDPMAVLVEFDMSNNVISAVAGLGDGGDKPISGVFVASSQCKLRISTYRSKPHFACIIRASEINAEGSSIFTQIAKAVKSVEGDVYERVQLSTTWTIGSISGTTGAESATQYRLRSDFIAVSDGERFNIDPNTLGNYMLYDENKTFISSYSSAPAILPTDLVVNIKGYIRIVLSYDSNVIALTSTDIPRLTARITAVTRSKTDTTQGRTVFDSEVADNILELSKSSETKIAFITDLHHNSSDVMTSAMSSNTAWIGKYLNFIEVMLQIRAISEISHGALLDFIVCGGDLIWGVDSPADEVPLLNEVVNGFKEAAADSAMLAGNHDWCDDYYAAQITPTDDDCITPTQLANFYKVCELYGYKDVEGIRIIWLNSSDSYIVEGGAKKYNRKTTFAIRQEQLDWFASTLAGTPNGYDVVVFSHFATQNENSQNYNGGNAVSSLLKHFNAKDAGTKTGCSGDFAFSVNYDFSANLNSKVVGVFSGHSHQDNMYVDQDGINQIVTTTATMFEFGALTREFNTLSEAAFDIICIDKANSSVHIKRFGAGSDRDFTY